MTKEIKISNIIERSKKQNCILKDEFIAFELKCILEQYKDIININNIDTIIFIYDNEIKQTSKYFITLTPCIITKNNNWLALGLKNISKEHVKEWLQKLITNKESF